MPKDQIKEAPMPINNKEWEEVFDNKVKDEFFPGGGDSYDFDEDACKAFIRQLLAQKEIETLEWVLKLVNSPQDMRYHTMLHDFFDEIDDRLQALKSKERTN